MILQFRSTPFFIVFSFTILAGCAGIPADRGGREVRQLAADRGQALPEDAVAAERSAQVKAILAQPLTETGVVRVAFLGNPRIQAEYARLGLRAAAVIQAGRLSNPSFSAALLSSSAAGDAGRYDLGLSQNVAELLLLPARTRFAKGEFERAKLDAAQALLDLAADVQSAYYGAVGARQVAAMRNTVATAASAAAAVSARYAQAGNFTALQLALDQAAESQAKLDQEQADAEAARADSALNALMGLDATAQWMLAPALPTPVSQEDALADLQMLASDKHSALDSDRRAVALLEEGLHLTRSYRLLGSVDIGVQYERDTDRNRLLGPSLSLQLPIFSQGQAPVLRAEAQLELARAALKARQLEISNGVRAAYERVMAARKRIDRLGGETIPLREKIVARTQEQLNFMLVGVFDLLRVRQDEYLAYQQYLEAVRDYWQARVDLARAVGTRLPSDRLIGAPVITSEMPHEARDDKGESPPDGSVQDIPGIDLSAMSAQDRQQMKAPCPHTSSDSAHTGGS